MALRYEASVKAPINLAVVKYWGKRDIKLNLPTNSSLSITLSTDDLCAHTSICTVATDLAADRLWLNGVLQEIGPSSRTNACLTILRKYRNEMETSNSDLPKLAHRPLLIVSKNNFPTAAGLASSAAGFAALVLAVKNLFNLQITDKQISEIARLGSGSACRSIFGGYVAWNKGEKHDGSDSVAEQIASKQFWPEMRAAILVISDKKKYLSSTTGMQQTAKTSALFQHRIANVVPQCMEEMARAVRNRDFKSFANLTMRDSNSFHAVCLDTQPPIFYLNDVSRGVINLVEHINTTFHDEGPIVAYTFDAGPNAVLFYEEKNEICILSYLQSVYNITPSLISDTKISLNLDIRLIGHIPKEVSKVILSRVGEGAHSVTQSLFGHNIEQWL